MKLTKATLMLWDEQVLGVDAHADQLGVSRSYAARMLLDWVLANPPSLVDLLRVQKASAAHLGGRYAN